MIRIAICDDNKRTLMQLEKFIDAEFRKITDDFSINCYENGTVLLNANNLNKFDVLFLDIDMPEISGFDIAKNLRASFSDCYIVFVSSHADLVYKSLDFQPFNFIRKNPSELFVSTLKNVVKKLMSNMKQNQSITLEDEVSGKKVVYFRNIVFIKSERHYLLFYIQNNDGPIKIRGSINDIEHSLEEYDFIRIHRSIIVNLRFISSIDTKVGKVVLNCDNYLKSLSLSKTYRNSLDIKYTLYLRKTL